MFETFKEKWGRCDPLTVIGNFPLQIHFYELRILYALIFIYLFILGLWFLPHVGFMLHSQITSHPKIVGCITFIMNLALSHVVNLYWWDKARLMTTIKMTLG